MMVLKASGLYGTTRGEIARALIQDMVKRLMAESILPKP